MEQNETISIEDRLLINCILSTRTLIDAAKSAKISRATLYRRLADPSFAAALADERSKILATITDELERLSLASVRRLWAYIENDSTDSKTVLRACGLALANAARYRENTDLKMRIEALEDALKTN